MLLLCLGHIHLLRTFQCWSLSGTLLHGRLCVCGLRYKPDINVACQGGISKLAKHWQTSQTRMLASLGIGQGLCPSDAHPARPVPRSTDVLMSHCFPIYKSRDEKQHHLLLSPECLLRWGMGWEIQDFGSDLLIPWHQHCSSSILLRSERPNCTSECKEKFMNMNTMLSYVARLWVHLGQCCLLGVASVLLSLGQRTFLFLFFEMLLNYRCWWLTMDLSACKECALPLNDDPSQMYSLIVMQCLTSIKKKSKASETVFFIEGLWRLC